MSATGKHSLLYGGVIILLLIGIASFVAYRFSDSMQQEFDQTLSLQIRKQGLFEDQIRVLLNRYYILRDIVTVEDAFDKDDLIQRHRSLATEFYYLRLELEAMPLSARDKELLGLLIEQTRKAYPIQQDLVERSIEETKPSHYQEVLDNIQPVLDEIYVEVMLYRDEMQEITEREINQARELYKQGWVTILVSYVLVIFLGIIAAVWIILYRRKRQQELQWLAAHDSLTELSNRVAFERAVCQQINDALPYGVGSILYLDLDRFKYVNDSCGHAAGDELLVQVSNRLKSVVRHSDMLARIGGNEFGIMLSGCDIPEAMRIADKILSALSETDFVWDTKHFEVSTSIGIAALDTQVKDFKQVISQADAACYTAKDLGRNRIHIYSESDAESSRRATELERVNQIRYALENYGFCLYRQKIEPLNPDLPRHYEILLRLLDEDNSIITPDMFLPEAERYDLISKIDLWVVQQTLNYLKTNEADHDVYAMNLSGKTLNDQQCLNEIVTEIKKSNVRPNILCFEITETAAIRDLSNAGSFLDLLQDMGCLVALDDFGTGLSSFNYLKQLPVDYLKIDGSFIRDLKPESQDYAFVKAIHAVSQAMGIQTIAEWVETPMVLTYLKDLHIDFAQGYHIARPEPLIIVT